MKQFLELKFSKISKKAIYLSAFYISLFLLVLVFKGLNLGMDFTGGILLEIRTDKKNQEIESALLPIFHNEVKVQKTEDGSYIVRADSSEVNIGNIVENIEVAIPDVQILKSEIIGATAGKDLQDKGIIAFFLSLLAMMMYISFRFQYKFAIGAILALIHDVIVVIGIFNLTGYNFNTNELVAVLAVMGYSVNDTIIIFDRIRENISKTVGDNVYLEHTIDKSIIQTLSRSFMTSFTTLLAVLALLFFGGETLFGFSLVICLGILVGTYSSIFIASWFLIATKLKKIELFPKYED